MKLHIDTFSRCRCRNYAVTLLGWLFAATMWGSTISPAIAQTVIGTHGLALSPYAIAINQITNRTYVTHGDSVTVIDGANNTVISTITVGTAPQAIAASACTVDPVRRTYT